MNWFQRLIIELGLGGVGGIAGYLAATQAAASRISMNQMLGVAQTAEEGADFAEGLIAIGTLAGAVGGVIGAALTIDALTSQTSTITGVPVAPPDAGVDSQMGSSITTTTNPDGSTTTALPDGSTITISTDPDGTTVTVINTPSSSQPGDDDPIGGGKQPPSDNPVPGEDGTDPVLME